MTIEPGEFWVADIPFTDASGNNKRAVRVLHLTARTLWPPRSRRLLGQNSVMEISDPTSGDKMQGQPAAAKPGLGDLAEAFFRSLGITEDRYKAVKVVMHLDPNCNCADRKRWLNEMGQKLGVEGVVVKMAKWMDRRNKG